ncbi:DUF7507 domain-containing protein [Thalassococcus sp. BH17M4-6]|uniref:DUF7507 domain-containing protein n=1 Tax=Thalassococcus sp. BH17M4-6 TaxID=3413148 RepID=UPI003BC4E828
MIVLKASAAYCVRAVFFCVLTLLWATASLATTFTTTVPGTSIVLPDDYPEAGGVAIVLRGVNGNLYYQFSDPDGAFVGFQNNGQPARFRGNPFTINDPISLDCGFSPCADYFGGGLAQVYIRFSAYDGDTQPGGFDQNDIDLILNGFNVGSWSGLTTEITNDDGTQSFGFATGFGNNTFNTGWFSSTNPALLSNILSTGQTVTQVFDDDPNDNYWDFRRGDSLGNPDIVTVAPGYTLEKTADASTYATVGETVEFTFVVTNIGSVPIRQLSVNDDQIGAVACDKTVILDTESGAGPPDFATCVASYEITQEDVDNGSVTNIANAVGVPDFGTLGALTDTVTLTGPTANPALFFDKSTTASSFGTAGTTVPYSFTFRNDGNVTLTDISLSDPLLPGISCNVPDLAPTENFTCSGTYTVTQADVDNVAADASWTLDNTATVTADAARGPNQSETDSESLPGDTPTLSIALDKSAITADFDAVGDTIQYEFEITNTGQVTFPAAPKINDTLTGGATCPTGAVAPGASITCSATYDIMQADLDAGEVLNTASVDITVGALSDSATDDATVPAVRTLGLTLDKRLAAASATSYATVDDELTYDYVLTNTGNVTLLTPTVTDDLVDVTCAATEIAPGTSVTCVSDPYVVDQGDLDDGSVTNTATAAATASGPAAEAVASAPDSVTVNAQQRPALSLDKVAPSVTALDYVEGNTVTYTYTVENTGNVTITQALTGASQITITDDKVGTFDCGPTPLAVGDTLVCTADYELTLADITAGQVTNVATAQAGPVQSPSDSAQIAPVFVPALSLQKNAVTASVSATSDTISYEFVVTNSGNAPINRATQPITINDPALSAAASCPPTPVTILPTESITCTGTRNGVTQTELDAGSIDNTATASMPFQGETIQSNSSSASIPVAAAPAMTFAKSGPAQFSSVGEVLTYTFEVTNTGNVTLDQVTVSDPLIPSLSCVLTDIAPLGSDNCSDTYTVTQADLDAEQIDNTATAVAVPTQGGQLTQTDTATSTAAPGAATKSYTLDKQADRATFAAVGEVITYTFEIENTGTQTLTDIVVTDSLDGSYQCLIPALAPTAINTICTYEHRVTQADIDAGSVVNTGSATADDLPTPVTDGETVTGPARTASYVFDKTADASFSAVNDVVDFTFAVANTGNVTLTNVQIDDPFFGTPVSCTIPSIAPGITDRSCTASYTVLQPDVDAGQITNTATASVQVPAGVTAPANQNDTAVVQGPAENAAVSIEKSSTDGVYTGATDSEVFTFRVVNTGNVTLTNLSLNDADLGFSCTLPDLLPGDDTTQCANTDPLTATRSFDQNDVDAGSYTNTVTVTGNSSGQGTAVSATDSETVQGPVQTVAISLAKNSTFGGTLESVGQTLTYDFVITNDSNITLTSDITISDSLIPDVNCPLIPGAGIPPGGTFTCTGDYRVTQADLDNGQVVNTAQATVTQSVIPQNPGDPANVTATSNTDDATVTVDQQPALRIAKRVAATSANSFNAPGDQVTFEYVVTNIGNVTTTDPITVDDDRIPGSLTCTSAPLAPGGQVTCQQVWTAAQPDVDAGEVTNTATADTVFGGNPVASAPDSVTINAVQEPSLEVEKTFVSTDNPGFFVQGDFLTYEIIVRNNGNVTIDAPITLFDNLTTPSCPAVPGGQLAPGDELICAATHTVTANDIDLGASTNVVYATGQFDGDEVRSPSDDAIYPLNANPALSLVKEALPANLPYDSTSDIVTYRFTVQNTGNVALSDEITIVDPQIDPNPLVCRAAASAGGLDPLPPAPDPDSIVICDFPYTITQSDLDRGELVNNATANTVFAPSGDATNVVSPAATATITAAENETLTVDKQMTSTLTDGVARAGDVLDYVITATNDGNQTLSGVALSDSLIPDLSCTVTSGASTSPAPSNVILAPGDLLTCSGTYTVTQTDIDNQTLVNIADATASDPQGDTVTGTDSVNQPLVAPDTAIDVVKTISPDPSGGAAFTDPGQPLTFIITVTNTGNITLATTEITDSLPVTPASCTVGTLAPGESDDSCEFTYLVTQEDIDADSPDGSEVYAGFTNTAFATAEPVNPALDDATDAGDVFVQGPDRDPQFTLVKESDTTVIDTWNQLVTYRYTVANIGNVTLIEEPVITDDKIGTFTCTGMPAGGIAPSEFYTCTQDYRVTEEDLDNNGVTNVATATSSEVDDPAQDTLTIPADQAPSLNLTKVADVTTGLVEGQVVTYTYTVVNDGNVTLSDVSVADQHTSASGTAALSVANETLTSDVNEQNTSTDATANDGVWSALAPGDTVTFTATYTVTQADLDAQADLTNVATVTGTGPGASGPAEAQATESVAPITKAPGLVLTKTADVTALSDPVDLGQEIVFTITVENTGNVTLDAPVLTDTLTDANGDALALSQLPQLTGGDDGDNALEVGETWTYTARFAVNQQALDAGGVENTVSATANDPQGTPVTGDLPTPIEVSIVGDPSLALVKTSALDDGGDGRADVGDEITYTYVITNTGNVTLFDAAVAETGFAGAGTAPVPAYATGGADLGGGAALDVAVGEQITFTATYALTQEDLDAGGVTNQATATADDPEGNQVDDLSGATNADDDPTETVLGNAPSLEIAKTADVTALSDPVDLGQEIVFTITVENTGNVTLDAPVLTDTLTDANGDALALSQLPQLTGGDDGDNALEVGETWTYTARFAVNQQALDAGGVENTVTATANDPQDDPATDTIDDPVVVTIPGNPEVSAVKTSVLNDGGDGRADVGDEITYTYVLTNTGNVTLFDAAVSETGFAGTGTTPVPAYASGGSDLGGGAALDLAVGQQIIFTATYTLTQADLDAGGVTNQATATADDPAGNGVDDLTGATNDDDIPTETSLTGAPALQVVKTASPALSAPPAVGDIVTYTIQVTNTGNVTLAAPVLTDTLTTAAGRAQTLSAAPTLTSGDTDANNALDVGEVWTYTAQATVTQEAIDDGGLSNTVLAESTGPDGTPASDLSDDGTDPVNGDTPTTTTITGAPALTVVKTASLDLGADGLAGVGDVITYEYTVANTGNVTLFDAVVTETGFGGAGTTPVPTPVSGGADLDGEGDAPDIGVATAPVVFRATYALTQADIDAGEVLNSATASASAPNGSTASDLSGASAAGDDPTLTLIPAAPGLEVVKTAITSGIGDPAAVGDEVTFVITVTNTGNVSLDTVSLVEDFQRRDGTPLTLTPTLTVGDGGAAGVLDVGEVWEYRATHTLTQADLDAGGVQNQVTVTADSPLDDPVQDVSDDDGPGQDPTLVPVTGAPSIEVTKSLAAGSPDPFTEVGQILTYTFEVTNSGNITITEAVSVADPLIDALGSVTCNAPPIAPGDSLICTGDYTITQDDLDTGSVENTATASVTQPVVPAAPGDPAEVSLEEDTNTVTTVADQLPALTIAKVLSSTSATSYEVVGDALSYDFTIANSGNVTLAGPFTVNDDRIGDDLTCGTGPLAPGASVTCTHTYAVTQDDLNDGEVTNTATGNTVYDGDPVVSDSQSATVAGVQSPELEIVKELVSATPDVFDSGTVLAYEFTVTNIGNVTISAPVTVNDSLADTVDCPAPAGGLLLPDATLTCTGSYTIVDGDLALGAVTNLASATGSFDGVDVTSLTDEAIYPVESDPALTLVKDSDPTDVTFAAVDDEITYTYTISNNSNVGFDQDLILTDNRLDAPFVCYSAADNGPLNVGETVSCTAVYLVTQEDLDAGEVTNEAVASTTFAPGTDNERTVSSNPAVKTVLADPQPELTLDKVIADAPAAASVDDVITFEITAENTGNQTIAGVTITDPLVGDLTCTVDSVAAPANVVLAPEQTLVCTGTYTVTQADVDAQTLTNTATVRGSDPDGGDVTDDASVDVPIAEPAPVLSVVKTVTPLPAAGQSTFDVPGDTVDFLITVRNDGNVGLRDITVTDDLPVTPASCSIDTLAPGEEDTSCIVTYTVTQADIDGADGDDFGSVVNTASATGTTVTPDAQPVEGSGDVTALGPDHAPAVSMEKTADVEEISTAGETVTYSYLVTNTGNITLTAPIEVTDDRIPNVNCPALPQAGLAPLGTQTCTGLYTVTQADLDSGELTNIATAFSDEATAPATPGEETDSVTLPVAAAPALLFEKIASETADVTVGTTLTYTYRVTNTGNQTLAAISVTDSHTSASGTSALPVAGETLELDVAPQGDSSDAADDGTWDALRPGDAVTFTAGYTVTQADVDAQAAIENTATVTALDPLDATVTDEVSVSVGVDPAAPSISALKVLDDSGLSDPAMAGETARFDITVTNDGNQTLDTITLIENIRRNDGTPLTLAEPPVLTGGDAGVFGVMEVGESWTYTAEYVLTQADVDAGGISNNVVVRGQSPDDTLVQDTSDDGVDGNGDTTPAVVSIPAAPELVAEKVVSDAATGLGEAVEFTISLRNVGNVTLNDVEIRSDTLTRLDDTLVEPAPVPVFSGADMGSSVGVLLPGETATYTVSHTLTQADIDAGGIQNTVLAAGTPPVGGPVTDSPDDPAINSIDAEPSIALSKSLAPDAPASFDGVGIEVPYVFAIENTGNVTLFAPVAIEDALLDAAGVTPVCDPVADAGLAPGGMLSCTATYVTTQEDVDAGAVVNTATATLGGQTSDPSTATITATQRPELTLDKIAPDMPSADFVTGAEAIYRFVTTNTGNITVTEPVRIVDTLIPESDLTCEDFPEEGLAPGADYVCTGTYVVTASDVDLGAVTNVAFATDGTTPSELDDAIIPNEGVPALTIEKSASVSEFTAVGDVIPYTFVVTNTGARAFAREVVVQDTLVGEVACFSPSAEKPDLVAGETVTCAAEVTVTQEDLDRGFVTNEAYAQTTFGADDTLVLSQADSVRVDGGLTPELTVTKSVAPLPVTGVGQVLTFTVMTVNTGNQTIANVVATDPMLTGFDCAAATLAPGEDLVCTGTYTVSQDDIDSGSLENTATVQGVSPQGEAVTDEVTLPVTLPDAEPVVALTKTAVPTPFGGVGSTLTYLFAVENTGNVTLSTLTVTDVLDPGFSCAITTLAPGQTDRSCSLAVTVTQAMVDVGSQTNTAQVAGTAPDGAPVSDSDTVTTDGPGRVPGLEATKILLPGTASVAGETLRYRLTVANTGNVTLTNLRLTDTMSDGLGNPLDLDAPFALDPASDVDGNSALDVGETWVFTAQYTLTQSDLNSGGITNQVTVEADDPSGAAVLDDSDDGQDGDGDATGDPTEFSVATTPELTVVKRVIQSGSVPGDTVAFEIVATNSGNLDISGLSVSDLLTRTDGSPVAVTPVAVSVPATLSPGDQATWRVEHVLTQADIDAGGLRNTALVRGTAADDTPVSDVSADDDVTDGNLTDDPTELLLAPVPSLTVIKRVDEIGTAAGEAVSFTIEVTNSGNVTLSGLAVTDELRDLDGENPRDLTPVYVSSDGAPPSPQGTLAPGETALYEASVTLLQSDVDARGVANSATASATTPQGGTLSDVSDDDGVGPDDPTVAAIVPLPSFEISKTAATPEILFPTVEQVTFTITATNTGNITQTDVQVIDDLTAFLAPAELLSEQFPLVVSVSGFDGASANPGYDGAADTGLLGPDASLAPGETGTITLTAAYSTAPGQPGAPNTASVLSAELPSPTSDEASVLTTDSDGDGIPDRLETGDRDGDGIPDAEDYDPTGYFYCQEDGRILTGGRVTVSGNGFTQAGAGTSGPITVVQAGELGYYQFHVTQAGSYTLSFGYPPTGTPSTTLLPGGPLDVTGLLPANPAALGSFEAGNNGVLIDPSAGANPFHLTFVFEPGDPIIISNNIPMTACEEARDVTATKTADRRTAVFGETINYTLTFRNETPNSYVDARVIDVLPAGLVYTPGSGRVNGAAAEPATAGGRLIWTADLPPNDVLTVTYAARVAATGDFGERTNRTWLEHASGRILSNVARATVTIEPEHVFDCADIIGKVFHDKNGNGYQDGPGTLREPILRDDYVDTGKGGGKLTPAPQRTDQTEPGMPRVRLVTPDGTLITTDEFGRFSVPCAALPRDIGSNFQLKLDTRTLPTGFRVTTENPRNIRVTAGKMARMNFGVALGKLVKIDLGAEAFVPGTAQASSALDGAIDGLVRKIARDPSFLRLTYTLARGEDAALGRARLRELERQIRRAWRGRGTYKLEVERHIVRTGG